MNDDDVIDLYAVRYAKRNAGRPQHECPVCGSLYTVEAPGVFRCNACGERWEEYCEAGCPDCEGAKR